MKIKVAEINNHLKGKKTTASKKFFNKVASVLEQNGFSKPFTITVLLKMSAGCDQCEMLNINGVNTHEQGCPNSWKGSKKECEWCGKEFNPKEKGQKCCCKSCQKSYNG